MRVVRVSSGEILDAAPAPRADGSELPLQPDLFPEEYPLVLVTWHDAFFDFDQTGPDDCRSDYLVRTVGFLVHEGARFVSIAQEVLPDGEGFRAVTHIPRSIVESLVSLHAEPTEVASARPADPYTASAGVATPLSQEGGMHP
jgi:hypothetical protein